MKRIPCRKCSNCGIYHNMAVEICDECGTALNNTPAVLMDKHTIPEELLGDFDTPVTVYVQKCSACGTLNFTTSKDNPVKICHNCHKSRVAAVEPVIYTPEDENVSNSDVNSNRTGESAVASETQQHHATEAKTVPLVNDDEEDDDLDTQDIFWLGRLQEGIGKAISGSPNKNLTEETKRETEFSSPIPYNDDDDDDDDDIVDWPVDLGGSQKQDTSPTPNRRTVAPAAKRDIILTALRYGRLSFTVEAGPDTYMLGRSANQGSFLSQDGRVGNEHCYLFYRNGNWFVKDNNSRNGTAVNSRDIGLNGECMLSNGDELKLGHHNDSVAFRISIG